MKCPKNNDISILIIKNQEQYNIGFWVVKLCYRYVVTIRTYLLHIHIHRYYIQVLHITYVTGFQSGLYRYKCIVTRRKAKYGGGDEISGEIKQKKKNKNDEVLLCN